MSEQRRLLYEKLLALAEAELRHCQTANWDDDVAVEQLNSLLEQRSQVIQQIDALEPTPGSDADRAILERIILTDQETNKILEKLKQQYADQLKRLKKGKQTTRAYNSPDTQIEGYFIDRKK